MRIFYNSLGTPQMYDLIRSRMGAGMKLITLTSDDDAERCAKIAKADVAIVAATPLTAQIIGAAERLKLVHHQGVGYHDTVDIRALTQKGAQLALTPEGTTIGVAEHTLLLALAAARRAAFADAELRAGRWHVNALRPVSVELYGKTVALIGFGRIGQEAAKRFNAFGCSCLYYDPSVETAPGQPARKVAFDEAVAQADVISCHLPLSESTRHLLSEAEIAAMKQDAIVVNTARGGIIDDAALAAALASGKLLAAGLDVFEGEPIGAGHAFCGLPNVILTPHISAGTRDAMGHKMTALFANLERFRRGEPLANEVALEPA